jgi:site-specific DNA-methyltransferase (adenine-specific)
MIDSSNNYNPDVLTCLANLSNDEVFTPPKLANQILDTLPKEIWIDKNIKFLDPVSKSGVFLREIAKRLIIGLESQIPDLQTRINHILANQVFGIAITEITALISRRTLYCAKKANGKYSISSDFADEIGNIKFDQTNHSWKNDKCIFCGAGKLAYERGEELETHAYQFIHNNNPEKIFNMKFDVIIGNPPYQLETKGSGKQAKPIYQKFIEQAIKLNPRFLSMIIPARWYAGGMGLDEFRKKMLDDKKISNLVDFRNSRDVFPGVDVAGGICYFLWQRDYQGDCDVAYFEDDKKISQKRKLNEFNIFIRDNKAISIIRKIQNLNKNFLSEKVSAIRPFGLPTNYQPENKGIPCWFIQKIGKKYAKTEDVVDNNEYLNKWKLLIPKAPIAGQTDFSKPVRFYHNKNALIAKPGECCTESYILAGTFESEEEVLSFKSYLFTKIVRFLILQTVISQDVNKKNFIFVPDLGKYEGNYCDEELCKKWNISEEEWKLIDSKILPANDQ